MTNPGSALAYLVVNDHGIWLRISGLFPEFNFHDTIMLPHGNRFKFNKIELSRPASWKYALTTI